MGVQLWCIVGKEFCCVEVDKHSSVVGVNAFKKREKPALFYFPDKVFGDEDIVDFFGSPSVRRCDVGCCVCRCDDVDEIACC